ncbi:response regulator [Marinobacterium sp. AK62]|uniref:Response regulator n=1 Tax=Marinobacterium alkalitolerans TaxID=1542925 RepID=A0ABS3Z6T4_9GAMM|nr:HD domain-containing phosphohydrolase [Marinobacterium alkalitolerans]MBP0047408.1 response regulator [Marinobacterium alkalitolerans]
MDKELTETPHAPPPAWKVLCVDDENSILRALKRLLTQHQYEVVTTDNGEDGLALLRQDNYDLIISDMRMPGMNGAEFLAQAATHHPESIRLLLTGYADMESTIAAVNEGRIHRYIQKPWDSAKLLAILDEELEIKRLRTENQALLDIVQQQNEQLQDSNAKLQSLNNQLEDKVRLRTEQIRKAMKNLETRNRQIQEQVRATVRVFYNLLALSGLDSSSHANEISLLCQLIAQALELNENETRQIKLTGLLAEVGVLCLPSELAGTPRFEMTEEQKNEFLSHPQLAFQAMSPVAHLSSIAHAIKHQFERFDGKGSPEGLAGEKVPLGSRVLALSRDYIFLIRGISHRTRYSSKSALDILRKRSGHIYDPNLVEVLPGIIPKLEADLLNRDEKVVSTAHLKPGMQLTRDVMGFSGLLLLSEGHRLTEETIERLKSYEENKTEPLEVFVLSGK